MMIYVKKNYDSLFKETNNNKNRVELFLLVVIILAHLQDVYPEFSFKLRTKKDAKVFFFNSWIIKFQ